MVVPVHQGHRRIGGKHRPQAGLLDVFLDLGQDGKAGPLICFEQAVGQEMI
jgi:hypothetical protein